MKSDNVIADKSEDFAIRIVRMCQYISDAHKEFILTNQVKRSGTSIGANVAEAVSAFSKAEFYSKLSISLKEARETMYWLKLLYKTDYLTEAEYKSINDDCEELVKILVAILKSKDVPNS